jgi:hypothetical protein
MIARRGKDGKPTSADYDFQTMTATDTMYSALIHKIQIFLKGLKAGIFLPAESGSWACSEKFCGYWSTCKYVGNAEQKRWF